MRLILITLTVLAALLALLLVGQRRLIYLPIPSTVPPVETALPGAEERTLVTDDGLDLSAWLARPTGHDRGVGVLVAPGNAGHRGMRAPLAEALRDCGFTVLLMDYRGYAGNPGRPTEAGLHRDALAARADLQAATGFADADLLYYGESIGTGVVAGLAAAHPPGGLVLRSPFPELADVGATHYPFLPVRSLLRDRYPVAAAVADLDVPVTVIYGTADRIVPPELSEQVAQAADDVEVVRVDADHNDPALLDGPDLIDAVCRRALRDERGPAGR